MKQAISIQGATRTDFGKSASKQMRNAGKIPCVLYGGEDLVHFTTTPADVRHLIYTPDLVLAEVTVEGQMHRCLVKEVQYHPVSDKILHIDFQKLVKGSPIKVEVPLRLVGSAKGVKSGGKLLQKVRRVKIKAMPENMVDELSVDVSDLDLGQSIRVRDIKAVSGIEILPPPGTPVASIEIPRALRGAAADKK